MNNITLKQRKLINDIYFLDFRLLSDKLRPKNKYIIAKIFDITEDNVTFLYGNFFINGNMQQRIVLNMVN